MGVTPPPPGSGSSVINRANITFWVCKTNCDTPNLTSFLGLLKQTHEIELNSLNAESEKWKPLGVSSAT